MGRHLEPGGVVQQSHACVLPLLRQMLEKFAGDVHSTEMDRVNFNHEDRAVGSHACRS
jgi:hypothetical protein